MVTNNDSALYLIKAEENLRAAESELANGRYNSSANRCYYACFQAAVAAILEAGIAPATQWSHGFVQAHFIGQLINRRKRYGPEFRTYLSDNQWLREKADYQLDPVTQVQESRALGRSRAFVHAIIGKKV